MPGKSRVAQLEGKENFHKTTELTVGTPGGFTVRTKRYRYIEWENAEFSEKR
jgi:hypothetical protein